MNVVLDHPKMPAPPAGVRDTFGGRVKACHPPLEWIGHPPLSYDGNVGGQPLGSNPFRPRFAGVFGYKLIGGDKLHRGPVAGFKSFRGHLCKMLNES